MSLWTVQQHEWLQALGHPVLLLAGDPSLQAPAAPAHPRSADPGHPQQAARPSPVIKPTDAPAPEPVAGAARTDAAAKRAALDAARGARQAIRRPLLPSEDPLLLAILRVSRMEAPVFEVAAQAWRIDLVRLRTDPAAKRSLWQQMRKARQNRDG